MERVVATILIALGFVVLAAWWLESRFGPELAVTVLLGVTHLLAFAGGAVLSYAITRGSLRAVNDYAKLDATVDRYRQQTFKEQARGDSALQRAAAQLQVIDARRVEGLSRDRAKVLIDADRRDREPQETWGWDEDETEDGYNRKDGWG